MNSRKISSREILQVMFGILFAIMMSAPYIIYKEQIQQMALVGYLAVLFASAISNISILIPSSSTLIVIAAASGLNPMLCVLAGGLGAALGEQSSYICGRIGRKGVKNNDSREKKVLAWIKKHDSLTVFIFAFLPLPIFDFVGIVAGVFRMKWIKYLFSAFFGKTLKFFLAVASVYYIIPAFLPFITGPGHVIIESFLEQFGVI